MNPLPEFADTEPNRRGTFYEVEPWPELMREMLPLLIRHWIEVAIDRERIPLDIDVPRYNALHDQGVLRIITVRRDGRLIGYHVAIFAPHLHYASTPHYITDVYWISPETRHGVLAKRMFAAAEADAAALTPAGKVCKLYTAVKLHLDQGPLFERLLGYRPTERLYTKVIEGTRHA